MSVIIIFGFIALSCWLSVSFRLFLTHPVKSIKYGVKDTAMYFIKKTGNMARTGKIIAFTGMFGRGKTLSAVRYVTDFYGRYNGKKVWDRERHMFVTQKVQVLSNVDILGIPYEKLESLSQVTRCAKMNKIYDAQEEILTITIVLGDEFGAQLNSRSFRDNINPLFLNTLLTSRHNHISLVYTSQRFCFVDSLLRQVTSYVVECNKVWRYQIQRFYDSVDLEYASNPTNLKPFKNTGFFVTDRDYEMYNTLACVDELEKKFAEGDVLSDTEILQLQNLPAPSMDVVGKKSRRWRRQIKKER